MEEIVIKPASIAATPPPAPSFWAQVVTRLRQNAGWGVHSTEGRLRWRWEIVGYTSSCCPASTPLMAMFFIIFATSMGINIHAIEVRRIIDADIASRADGRGNVARYGTSAMWFMDISSFVFVSLILYAVIAGFLVGFSESLSAERVRSTEEPQPVYARVARFCATLGLVFSTLCIILYTVFAATNDHHTLPSDAAAYSLNFIYFVAIFTFSRLNVRAEHLVWVLAVGLIYAFVFSGTHYLQCDWDDRRPYIYGAVDWSRPAVTLLHLVGLAVLASGIHIFWAKLSAWKNSAPGTEVYEPLAEIDIGAGHRHTTVQKEGSTV
jgi:hypothetical protein